MKQAVHKLTNIKVAIKIYDKFKLQDNVYRTAVKREIQVMQQINHENIVKLYEVIDCSKQVNNINVFCLDIHCYGISYRCFFVILH